MSLENAINRLAEAVEELTAKLGNMPAPAVVEEASEEAVEPPKPKAKGKAKAKPKKPAKRVEEQPEDEEEEAEDEITVAMVRTAIQDAVSQDLRAEASQVLKDHGASKLSELEEENYESVYNALKELID